MNYLLSFTFIAFISIQSVFGQITLDQSDMPDIGLGISVYQPIDVELEVSQSGMNQTWDMSSVSIPDTVWVSLTYVDPLSLDSGSFYPDANLATTNEGGSGIGYYSSTESMFSMVGSDAGPYYFTYDEPYELMPLPLSYGDNHEFEWSYQRFQHANDEVDYFEGVTHMEVDGFGDLILPYGVVENVLRIKYEHDFFRVTDEGVVLSSDYTTDYRWFIKGLGHLVARLIVHESLGDFQAFFFVSEATLTSEVKELKSEGLDFQLFPNPASERLQIDCRNFRGEGRFMNASGQIVKSFSVTQGENILSVDELSPGLYMVQLIDSDGQQATRRLVIE